MYSEAQKKATAKYNSKAYDRIEIKVPKGQKEIIEIHAKEKGLSLNKYICGLIENDLKESV